MRAAGAGAGGEGGGVAAGLVRGRFGYLRMLFRYFAITMQLQ